jgi:hypothetical protein
MVRSLLVSLTDSHFSSNNRTCRTVNRLCSASLFTLAIGSRFDTVRPSSLPDVKHDASAGLRPPDRPDPVRIRAFDRETMLPENNPSSQSAIPERRSMRRFDMRLPTTVQLQRQSEDQTSEFQTETQNVSARGVFFYLDRPVPAGTRCEVTLTFPPHITLTDSVRVRFTARVIRSESPMPSQKVGTAAIIEDYEFLRSSGTPDFLSALRNGWKRN